MPVKDGLRRLRYAAVSISLFGLLLTVGTWAFQVWLEHAIETGRGGVYLRLTPEEYRALRLINSKFT
jgi:hypothetical protein